MEFDIILNGKKSQYIFNIATDCIPVGEHAAIQNFARIVAADRLVCQRERVSALQTASESD